MYQNRRRIPFRIPSQTGTEVSMTAMVEQEVRGLIGLEDDALVLQLQTSKTETSMETGAVNTEDSDVTELRIPLDQLAGAHSGGWWGRQITLVANDLRAFKDIPGGRGEQVVLRFRRRDRTAIDELVTTLSFELSDLGHARLDERIRKLEADDDSPGRLPGAP